MKKITGILIKPYDEIPRTSIALVDDDYKALQEVIDVRCFTIVRANIGGKFFDIVADDEGLFVEHPRPSVCYPDYTVAIYGNIFICRHDGRGNQMSLTTDDIELIQSRICYMLDADYNLLPILKIEF